MGFRGLERNADKRASLYDAPFAAGSVFQPLCRSPSENLDSNRTARPRRKVP
jgi:hypothetical protein